VCASIVLWGCGGGSTGATPADAGGGADGQVTDGNPACVDGRCAGDTGAADTGSTPWVRGVVGFANRVSPASVTIELDDMHSGARSDVTVSSTSANPSYGFPVQPGTPFTLSIPAQPTQQTCAFLDGKVTVTGTMGATDQDDVDVICRMLDGGACGDDAECQSGHCVFIGDLEATQIGWPGTTTGKDGHCYSAGDASELLAQQAAAIAYAPLVYLAADENYFPSSVEALLQHEVVDCVDPTSGAELTPGMSAMGILSPGANIPLDPSHQAQSPCGPTPAGATTPHDGCCRLNLTTPLIGGLDCNAAFMQGPGPTGTGTMSPLVASDCSDSKLFSLFKGDSTHLSSSKATSATDATVVPIYATIYGYGPGYFNVEYKTFYPYNYGKQACDGLWNSGCQGNWAQDDNHVADWEGMSIQFVNYKPAAVRTAAHSTDSIGTTYLSDGTTTFPIAVDGGVDGPPPPSFDYPSAYVMAGNWQVGSGAMQGVDSRPWNALQWANGAHPIVYSASGSHGIWGDTGDANNLHNYMITPTGEPLFDHTTQGLPWETWRHVVVVQQAGQAVPWYSQYKGRWGEDPVTVGETTGGCTSTGQGITDGRQMCGACQGHDCSACQIAGMQNICANASLPGGYEFPGFSLCFGADGEYVLNSGPYTPNGVRDVPTLPSRLLSLLGDTSPATAIQLPATAFQPCAGATAPTCPSADTTGTVDPVLAQEPAPGGSETLNRAATFRLVPALDPTVVDGVSIEAFTLTTSLSSMSNAPWFVPGSRDVPTYRYYLKATGSAGKPVDVEADDGTQAFHGAATFKMHQSSSSNFVAFESDSAPGSYLTGGLAGPVMPTASSPLSLAASAADPVTSSDTPLLFSMAQPLSTVQPGAFYNVIAQAPILNWNNGGKADWGCAALHVTNNTTYHVWITTYDVTQLIQYDYGYLPPATEWTLTDGPCFAGYSWGSTYHIRAQVYPTFQDLVNDTNQVYDTRICEMPEYQGAVLWAIIAGAYILAPELTTTVLGLVFAGDGALATCDANAASQMASFFLDSLDSNGAATQKVLGFLSTSIDNLNDDHTSVGLWATGSNFYWSDPGFSPSEGGGNCP
jgi:hypothetical protein